MHQYQDAIKQFSQALTLDPGREWALYYRGLSHDKLGEYSLADEDFSRVIELAPGTRAAELAQKMLSR